MIVMSIGSEFDTNEHRLRAMSYIAEEFKAVAHPEHVCTQCGRGGVVSTKRCMVPPVLLCVAYCRNKFNRQAGQVLRDSTFTIAPEQLELPTYSSSSSSLSTTRYDLYGVIYH